MSAWTVSFSDRLDAFLASEGRMLSRAKAKAAIESGRVKVNGKAQTKPSYRLQEGDRVSVEEPEVSLAEEKIEPADLSLKVLYEDSQCMVVDKPAGIAVHPGAGMAPGELTMLNGAAYLYSKQSLPFSSSSVLVHRLDKDTTGCLLIAKNPASHVFLQRQFQARQIKKQYLALISGRPDPASAIIDAPIGRSSFDRTTMSVRGVGTVREAQTTYRTMAASDKAALLLCDLHTGRTHQARVHLSSIGHPVLGDGTYRSLASERLAQENEINGLCLHAWKLEFISPEDEKRQQVIAPLPSHFERALEKLGIEWKARE